MRRNCSQNHSRFIILRVYIYRYTLYIHGEESGYQHDRVLQDDDDDGTVESYYSLHTLMLAAIFTTRVRSLAWVQRVLGSLAVNAEKGQIYIPSVGEGE